MNSNLLKIISHLVAPGIAAFFTLGIVAAPAPEDSVDTTDVTLQVETGTAAKFESTLLIDFITGVTTTLDMTDVPLNFCSVAPGSGTSHTVTFDSPNAASFTWNMVNSSSAGVLVPYSMKYSGQGGDFSLATGIPNAIPNRAIALDTGDCQAGAGLSFDGTQRLLISVTEANVDLAIAASPGSGTYTDTITMTVAQIP